MSHPHHAHVEHPKRSREEIAKIEIGHTQASPGVTRTLSFVFIAIIVAVPVMQTLRELPTVPQWCDVFKFPWPKSAEIKAIVQPEKDSSRFAAAKAYNDRLLKDIGTYERELKDGDAMIQWLIPRMQTVITGWLRGGNEDAYCGRDGWLFYRRDIDSLTGRGFLDPAVLRQRAASGSELKAPPQPDPVKAIVSFRDQLAERDIQLIVMPAPVKPSIHPEFHSSRYEGRPGIVQNPSYNEFKRRLAEAGVTVFDPADLLAELKASQPGQPLYLKTDTHWTPQTMEATAARLAGFAREQAKLPDPQENLHTTAEVDIQALGDVATMLKLPEGQNVFPPEKVRLRQVLKDNQLWRPSADAEVLFLGDSFANIFSLGLMNWGESAGFVEHLSLALGLPVDAITRNDAGSHVTRELLSNEMKVGRDRLQGKKLVIWEFASRELSSGDWKELSMALGEKRDVGMYVPAEGRTVAIKGTVRAASPSPRPGSVPYKDHILMLHLENIESNDDPDANGKEAVVKTWSMRDNVATPASRYRPGDTVRLSVRPWVDVQAKYGSVNGSLLDNDDAVYAEHGWADYEAKNKSGGKPVAPTETTAPDPEPRPTDGGAAPDPNDLASVFRDVCAKKAADAGKSMAVAGADDWLFLNNELRHLGVGPFWGENAAKVSKAKGKDADPIPAILDFKKQLDAQGIELILAPVPPKAVIYPDKISDAVKVPADGKAPARLDSAHQEFYKLLRDQGVNVLDLTDDFLANRMTDDGPMYCRQDTHWSGLACNHAAKRIAEMIRKMDWYGDVKRTEFKQEVVSATIAGDLWNSLEESKRPEKETLKLRKITTDGSALVKPDPASPVILLGDSHNLIFQAGGDMLASGSGLADQLAYELGLAVDLLAVRGSGATPARINLYRAASKPDYLSKKKVVVWCFTAREFTESQGWRIVPLTKK